MDIDTVKPITVALATIFWAMSMLEVDSALARSPADETGRFVYRCSDPRWKSDKGVCDGTFYAAAQTWANEQAQPCYLKSIREVSDGMLSYLSAHPEHGGLMLLDGLRLAIAHSPDLCSPNVLPVVLSESDLAPICGWRVALYEAGLCEGFVAYVADAWRFKLQDRQCWPHPDTILITVKTWADTAPRTSERPAIVAVQEVVGERFSCTPTP